MKINFRKFPKSDIELLQEQVSILTSDVERLPEEIEATLIIPIGTPINATASTLTTTLTGDNNDLVFISKIKGVSGNNIAISYVDPEVDTAACSVIVRGVGSEIEPYLIDVTLSYAESAITATANDIIAAIEDDTSADLIVSVALYGEDTGEGLVTAMESTSLEDGVDGTPGTEGQSYFKGGKHWICNATDLTIENDNWLSTTLT